MPKAILSVYDKTGLVELASGLVQMGWDLVASGGTARLLSHNHLPVIDVSAYTSSPEVLSGRVKTLHPAIHAGILSQDREEDRAELSELGWDKIDLVVVNLYPFERTIAKPEVTFADAIENIDIGGVTLIRAAAKNHERAVLVCDPGDYPEVLEYIRQGGVPAEVRKQLAIKGFMVTYQYDQAIHAYLSGSACESLRIYPILPLRYGENPHQEAALYGYGVHETPLGGKILQGKELSYNNILDLDAAWRAVTNFTDTSVVIVKHLSPCGIASASRLVDAYQSALACDPVSAYGGIVACNVPLDKETALEIRKLFVECVICPGFSSPVMEILAEKKNCRLLEMPDLEITPQYEYRSVNRGILKQTIDRGDPSEVNWQVVSKKVPDDAQWLALRFAWKACQHIKSNAIVFAKGTVTVGIGGGQPNRVDCVRMAAQRAGEKAIGAVMASDAFFPFPDSIEIAKEAGISAVIHPGGSIRDKDAVEAADRAGMAMVTTGVRHFRH